MNVSITIPNNFRNNSLTYIFQVNLDSDLYTGDYFQLTFGGNWKFFIEDCRIIEGIASSYSNQAKISAKYNTNIDSKLFINNFSSVSRESQVTFYVSLKTPLNANNYSFSITAYRSNNQMVEYYSQNISINATTGYIR